MSKELAKLTRKADAVAISASHLLSDQIKIIQGEIASWGKRLNIAGSAKDREVVYELIRKRMKQLSRKLDALMAAQNELAGKTAAKVASDMTGLDIKYSAKRAEAITELVTPAQGKNLAAVFTERMSNHLINTLRQATVEALREQAITGGTLKELSKELAWKWMEKAKEPPVFVDAGGKAWNTQTYFQMQSRTNSMRIYNDCLIDDVARETGSDIMRISRGGDPNCHCFAWEGCIISISGKTKGLPTYEQARKGGCFHPNCTHTLEYVDEAVDSDEIELAKSHPVVQGKEDDADAQYDRRREIDIARKMREDDSISRSEAEVLVDRDNLAGAIRTGLVRSDARQIVDALTDVQVRALITNGRTPRFEPTKKATKKDPHAADEKWIHGKRGGVVHISRTTTVEDLVKVTGIKDAKEEWKPQTELEKKTDALMQSIGAKHTDKPLSIDGVNPNYANGPEYRNNCQRCVPTYEARMRGYEVEALSSDGDRIPGLLNLARNSRAVWKNQQIETFTAQNFKPGVERRMAGWGDGARAEIRIGWRGKRFGHVFVAVQENGVTKFVDPQHPSSDASQYFSMAARSGSNAFHWLLRIDDNEFTDEAKRCFKHL